MKLLILSLAPLILGASAAPTSGNDPAVAALLERYRIAWDAGDAAALADLYLPAAELADSRAIVQGRADIAKLYRGAFDAGFAGSRLAVKIETTLPIAPGTFYGRGVSRIVLKSVGGTAATAYCGRFFAVIRRGPGGWRIATFNEVSLACDAAFP